MLYVLAVILAGLYSLTLLAAGFSRGAAIGVLALIAVPLFFLLTVIYTRVILEVLIVIFRMHENIAAIAQQQRVIPLQPVTDGVPVETVAEVARN